MYAISLDIEVSKIKEHHWKSYTLALQEITKTMDNLGFDCVHGSLYLARDNKNSLTTVYITIDRLKNIDWFKRSIRDIRVFKVDDWSDFTEVFKS